MIEAGASGRELPPPPVSARLLNPPFSSPVLPQFSPEAPRVAVLCYGLGISGKGPESTLWPTFMGEAAPKKGLMAGGCCYQSDRQRKGWKEGLRVGAAPSYLRTTCRANLGGSTFGGSTSQRGSRKAPRLSSACGLTDKRLAGRPEAALSAGAAAGLAGLPSAPAFTSLCCRSGSFTVGPARASFVQQVQARGSGHTER